MKGTVTAPAHGVILNGQIGADQIATPPTTPDHQEKPPLIAIVGPTGVGKTAASIALGTRFPAEIINADSRSFYRGMDIGTAKPDRAARSQVPHHLVDILEPDEPMSLATFQDLTYACIDEIHTRCRIPLLVGGTPQYVNAVVEGWSIPRVPPNEPFRQELERVVEADGVGELQARLRAVDPIAADAIGPNPRRIIRALEVFEATGQPITALQTKQPVPFRTLEFELHAPREILYDRIDARVDDQIAQGLVAEVEALLARGISPRASAFSSIGYRQVVPYLQGESSLDAAIERIKFDSHRLVRQQQTWFRKNPRLIRIDTTEPAWLDRLIAQVDSFASNWRSSCE
ncbi:MAG TPA: tRNA (adenosine(37)-N6)-dimethylallyltransferase MiaA [Thermomicrobiales bacterium]|nr:tRNA (adenosine(37)-N6)-dimethylallyltransferase MiaA [Thermomicrobiales bacterium]